MLITLKNKPYRGEYADLRLKYAQLETSRHTLHQLYIKQLLATVSLQVENTNLENWCQFYKQVDKDHRHLYGA